MILKDKKPKGQACKSKGSWLFVFLYAVLSAALAYFGILTAYGTKDIVNGATGADFELLKHGAIYLLILVLIQITLKIFNSNMYERARAKIEIKIRTSVFESKMKKTASVLTEQYDSVRAGKANPAVLDRITVDYYGSPTPIQQIASISTPDARSLLIQPWDASVLKGIEKAILASDLGLNPQNDGRTIRLVFPALTEERRRDLVKQVKKYGEEAKVAVRNIRRDAMDKFKAQKKKSEITEDDLKIIEKDLQKLTDDYIKEVERIADEKEKELMEI